MLDDIAETTEANQQASPAAVGFWATYVKVAVGPPSTSTFVSCQIEEYGKWGDVPGLNVSKKCMIWSSNVVSSVIADSEHFWAM